MNVYIEAPGFSEIDLDYDGENESQRAQQAILILRRHAPRPDPEDLLLTLTHLRPYLTIAQIETQTV
jgi:hypothetical protein